MPHAESAKKKFATQIDTHVLSEIHALARKEGRHIQTLVGEALLDLLEKRRREQPREHVLAAYRESLERFDPLYRKLAE